MQPSQDGHHSVYLPMERERLWTELVRLDRFAVRVDRWKGIFGKDERATLFDLRADPGETQDAAGANLQVVQHLESHWRQADSSLQGPAEIDEKLRDALRALGYAAD